MRHAELNPRCEECFFGLSLLISLIIHKLPAADNEHTYLSSYCDMSNRTQMGFYEIWLWTVRYKCVHKRPPFQHTPPAIAQWLHNRAVVRQWSVQWSMQWSLEVIGVSGWLRSVCRNSVSPHNSLGLCVVASTSPCVQWLRPRDRCSWTRVSSEVIRGQLRQWRLENVYVSLQKRVKNIIEHIYSSISNVRL